MNQQVARSRIGAIFNGRRWRAASNYLFIAPAILFLLGFMIYPIVFNIRISFFDPKASNLIQGEQTFVGLDNYASVLADSVFIEAATNTILFTGGSLVFQIAFGMGLALFYNQDFPGSKLMRSFYFVPWTIPVVVTGAVFRWLLDGQFGVLNWLLQLVGLINEPIYWLVEPQLALYAVIFTNIWLGIPLNMSILLAGLQNIPEDLYEAASIDGANRVNKFAFITFPLLRPALLVVLMLGLIYTFKVFALIWVMTKGGPVNATQVMATLAYKLVFEQFIFGKGAAVLNLLFVVLFIFSLGYLYAVRLEERTE
jgi:multiple sugar transport system permease protein